MPGRYPVYPEGTEVVNVPLTLSHDEAAHLAIVAPTRTAGARIVIQDRVAADLVAYGEAAIPETEAEVLDACASCARFLKIARAIGDQHAIDRYENRLNELLARVSRPEVREAGLAVN